MGKIVLAAKVTHVPSLLISERDGPMKGKRAAAIDSLKEIGNRARARGVDTYLVFDTHWLANFGAHVNANGVHKGVYTSHEAPHMIQGMEYDYRGHTALARAIAAEGRKAGLDVMAHEVATLPLEYGTIVPMHYMNADGAARVVSIASPLFASVEQNRRLGEAARKAIEAVEGNVAILASGSLSHKLIDLSQSGPDQWDKAASEFNRQVDLRVLDLWRERRYAEFCAMLPEYAVKCNGEGFMADTAMLFGALGWGEYKGEAEELCPYFPSSGSGQINMEFHV